MNCRLSNRYMISVLRIVASACVVQLPIVRVDSVASLNMPSMISVDMLMYMLVGRSGSLILGLIAHGVSRIILRFHFQLIYLSPPAL